MGAVSFYIIGLPISAILGLETKLELLGIWTGNAIGLAVAAVLMGAKILSVNWGKVVGEAASAATAGGDLDAPLAMMSPPQQSVSVSGSKSSRMRDRSWS